MPKTVYTLRLTDTGASESSIRRLRAALKYLLRCFCFKAEWVEEHKPAHRVTDPRPDPETLRSFVDMGDA